MTVTNKNPKDVVGWYFDQVLKQLEGLTHRTDTIEHDVQKIQIDTAKMSIELTNIHEKIANIKVCVGTVEEDVEKLNECYHGLDKQLAVKIGVWSFLVSLATVAIAIITAILVGAFDKKTEYVYPSEQINTRSGNKMSLDTTYRLEDHQKH